MNEKRTNLLSAELSFFRGMGRILDMGSTRNIYNSSSDEAEADYNAIMSDWDMVGKDLENEIRKLHRDIRRDGQRQVCQ